MKRAFDILVASLVLILLAPLMALVALAIVLESPGPVFYRAHRIGYRGRPLRMLKFRKMHPDAAGLPLTTANDARLTRVGALLAKLKLDELPQFWHVVRGEMSIVGPRPEDPEFVALHPEYDTILQVRPGITGPSQIAFTREGEVLDTDDPLAHYRRQLLPQKVTLDRTYAITRGLRTDLRVLAWTVVAVVVGLPVAVDRRDGRMRLRRRGRRPQRAVVAVETAGVPTRHYLPDSLVHIEPYLEPELVGDIAD